MCFAGSRTAVFRFNEYISISSDLRSALWKYITFPVVVVVVVVVFCLFVFVVIVFLEVLVYSHNGPHGHH